MQSSAMSSQCIAQMLLSFACVDSKSLECSGTLSQLLCSEHPEADFERIA